MKKKPFECEHCHQRYTQEVSFIKHKCKRMVRQEEFKTAQGQLAWACYLKWFKFAKRRAPVFENFMNSSQYDAFMRFAKFIKQVNMVDIDSYIKIMLKHNNIPPYMWNSVDAHALYLARLDHIKSPLEMVNFSVDTLFDVADEHTVEVSKVFDVITPNEIIQFIQRRKISPWLLIKSKKFLVFYHKKTTTEERIKLDALIKFDYWSKKLSTHPVEVKHINTIVAELNL